MARAAYKRILLKLSGEALMGERQYGIDPPTLELIASQIKNVLNLGVQAAVVVGGGNIFRGTEASQHGMERATADYAGMLTTIINAVALQAALFLVLYQEVFSDQTGRPGGYITESGSRPRWAPGTTNWLA